jgi:hypothetical protein
MVERLVDRDARRSASDHDGQLGLVVGRRRLGRDDDRLAGADHAVGELREQDRDLGDREVRLLGVIAVVQADADDLPRRRHGRQDPHLVGGHGISIARLSRREIRHQVVAHRDHAVALGPTEPAVERDEPHGLSTTLNRSVPSTRSSNAR